MKQMSDDPVENNDILDVVHLDIRAIGQIAARLKNQLPVGAVDRQISPGYQFRLRLEPQDIPTAIDPYSVAFDRHFGDVGLSGIRKLGNDLTDDARTNHRPYCPI